MSELRRLPRVRRAGPTAVVAAAATVSLLVGCSGAPAPAASPRPVTVLAAASLRDVMARARDVYAPFDRAADLRFAYGASSMLRTQIEQGAPADLFLSADVENPTRLVDAGLVDGRPVAVASNSLAIVTPPGDSRVASPFDLARPGLRVIAAGEQVPITRYARELLGNLARLPGAPARFPETVETNIVSREEDVRAVLARIELGEGDAAIVYASDVRRGTSVRRIPIPPEAQVVTLVSGVVLVRATEPERARSFLRFLIAPEGATLFEEQGFLRPG